MADKNAAGETNVPPMAAGLTNKLNLRAIGLMVLSMLCFAIEDMFIKIVSSQASVAQILVILGAVGGLFYMWFAFLRGEKLTRDIVTNKLLWARTLSEVFGTFGFVMALALIPLSNASAILQATPLVVTMAAALLLRESVGWRRWTAVFVGFLGVLLIIRPGSEGFDANSIFAVIGALGLAGRDVITRRIPVHIPTSWISAQAFWGASLLGFVMLAGPQRWEPLTAYSFGILMIASIVGIIGYFAITTATRIGETSVIAPFRYARLIFALFIGYVVFGERPDFWILLGSAILISTGIFAIYREQIAARAEPKQ